MSSTNWDSFTGGCSVLLATHGAVNSVLSEISDLVGAPLARLDVDPLRKSIHNYLNRLYTNSLARVDPVPFIALPTKESNLFLKRGDPAMYVTDNESPYGPKLRVTQYYPPIEIPVGTNLFPGARASLVLRATSETADYSIYFRVRYKDRTGTARKVWLGITSLLARCMDHVG